MSRPEKCDCAGGAWCSIAVFHCGGCERCAKCHITAGARDSQMLAELAPELDTIVGALERILVITDSHQARDAVGALIKYTKLMRNSPDLIEDLVIQARERMLAEAIRTVLEFPTPTGEKA